MTKLNNLFSNIFLFLSNPKVGLTKYRWRKKNPYNKTRLITDVPDQSLIEVGNYSYGDINILNETNDCRLKIGSFCSIGSETEFLLGGEHQIERVSSFPYKVYFTGQKYEATSKGNITIDDDVWIGFRTTIMSGIHIGQGAVVAAGAVVTKDVPPYAIVGGVPAKVIKYRFSPEVIDQLIKLDYSKLTDDMIREKIVDLYTSLDDKSPEEVKKLLEWFPKKQ